MTFTFPPHARANFERTDQALSEIMGLCYALDMALDDPLTARLENSHETLAKDSLLRLLIERVEGIVRYRSMEWAGQGGKTDHLTPDEIAAARGETQKK
jgi:hypothetical protein